MPITLTTAFNPGDNDPGQTYPEVKIVGFQWLQDSIRVTTEYGTTPGGGGWVAGGVAPQRTFTITGADYDALVAELPENASELIYNGVKRCLYQWLLDNNHFVGTIT